MCNRCLVATLQAILALTATGISSCQAEHRGKMEEFMYFEYDREVMPDEPSMGLLIECDRTADGQMHPLDGYWCSEHNRIATGDVHPGAFGCAALNLRGSAGRAHYRFGTHYQRYGETNGKWHVRFWAKAHSGQPRLTIAPDPDQYGELAALQPAAQWTQYDQALSVRPRKEITYRIVAGSGCGCGRQAASTYKQYVCFAFLRNLVLASPKSAIYFLTRPYKRARTERPERQSPSAVRIRGRGRRRAVG